MSYKCVLTPHHRIPKPILSILVGRLPQVSTTIEDVTDDAVAASDMSPSFHKHGKDDKDDRGNTRLKCCPRFTLNNLSSFSSCAGDSWDKDWNWGDEEVRFACITPERDLHKRMPFCRKLPSPANPSTFIRHQ